MEISERVMAEVAAADPPDAVGFATRQPGIARYLEARFAKGSDGLSVAVDAAARVCAAYELTLGLPPQRAASGQLERAEAAILDGTSGALSRQPALALFVAKTLASPVLPLDKEESGRLGLVLAAIVTALEETTTGLRHV